MGISVADLNRGDIVILSNGADGAYGKYVVNFVLGDSGAVLFEVGADGSFRHVLKPCQGGG